MKARFKGPEAAGPPETLHTFAVSDRPIETSGVSVDEDAWRIEAGEAGPVPLFEVPDPEVERSMLTYGAELRTADLEGGTYLEMWCRFAGRGEFFSKGLHQKVKGTTGWSAYQVPFYLKAGERPDLIRLNVAFEGSGTLWIRRIELLRTPLH